MDPEITGDQINAIIRAVIALTPDGDAQLTILARAFVVSCVGLGIERRIALRELSRLFDEPIALVPLDRT